MRQSFVEATKASRRLRLYDELGHLDQACMIPRCWETERVEESPWIDVGTVVSKRVGV